ncbi:MAG: hypothetical protein NVS2B4_16950 [Ramlibacter sp.]
MDKVDPKAVVKWLDAPQDHDCPAAASYLALVGTPEAASVLVDRLNAAPITLFKAKDILRASGLPLLGISNSHVERDAPKIRAAKPLSPILLVRDVDHGRVTVADGYHRMCAIYSVDEDATIPCKIV